MLWRIGAATIVGLTVLALPAAADEPRWTGFYVGGHAGYGWADWDGRYATTAGCGGPCPVFDPANPVPGYNIGMANPFQTLSGDGWLGGGQIGFNLQNGAWVFGLEADVSGGELEASGGRATDEAYNASIWDKKVAMSLDSFGTVRARLGYANGSVMPYLTGGLAWGNTSGDLAVTYTPNGYKDANAKAAGTSFASADESHLGWTVGGGVEWKLGGGFSVKAEYLYVDLGSADYAFKGETYTGAAFDTDSFPADLTFHTVRLGLNYKLY
ncbi:MAG TPA: outer membrane beta-barrel protein [Hyphomicrobiaceae bacterium]|nr:outer membrane beta-barrel protein [Hyphomicrobiaceae bacterium]